MAPPPKIPAHLALLRTAHPFRRSRCVGHRECHRHAIMVRNRPVHRLAFKVSATADAATYATNTRGQSTDRRSVGSALVILFGDLQRGPARGIHLPCIRALRQQHDDHPGVALLGGDVEGVGGVDQGTLAAGNAALEAVLLQIPHDRDLPGTGDRRLAVDALLLRSPRRVDPLGRLPLLLLPARDLLELPPGLLLGTQPLLRLPLLPLQLRRLRTSALRLLLRVARVLLRAARLLLRAARLLLLLLLLLAARLRLARLRRCLLGLPLLPGECGRVDFHGILHRVRHAASLATEH
mmetsp:Transcript_40297/g.116472  ORF Transcript_40297/g.116472 Transcript_40297/m.116472 type:complete len:294 (-) Transcript_40297:74-955(-)